jgi:hypothetical protein
MKGMDIIASVSIVDNKVDPGTLRLGPMALPPKVPAGILDASLVCQSTLSAACQAATTRTGPACAAPSADLTTACTPVAPQTTNSQAPEPLVSTGGGGQFVDPPPQVGADDPAIQPTALLRTTSQTAETTPSYSK